jgi:hypothetical protein
MNSEKIKHHIQHLEKEHDELEHDLVEQQKHYGEDRLVTIIKKKKLQIKDEIQRMRLKIK